MTIKPMLAVPQSKGNIIDWNDWAIERKFDGHRLVIHIEASGVTAWTRPRKHAGDPSGKTMVRRDLPPHLVAALKRLPLGVFDTEQLAGVPDATATDVTRLDLQHTLYVVVFDVMQLGGADQMRTTYDERRSKLELLLYGHYLHNEDDPTAPVRLAASQRVTCEGDVADFVSRIWAAGGEGAILKRRNARYQQKRSPDFVKIKRGEHALLTVVGFEATRGSVLNRGAFASVILQDDDGNETSCKTKDDVELEAFNKQWERVMRLTQGTPSNLRGRYGEHPAMGRKLWVNFPMRTRSGGYQGPVIWDRWEEE